MRSDRNDYGQLNQWQGGMTQLTSGGTTTMQVQFGARTETFTLSGSTWTPNYANGATLTAGSGTYAYRSSDGALVTFGLAWMRFRLARATLIMFPQDGSGCAV